MKLFLMSVTDASVHASVLLPKQKLCTGQDSCFDCHRTLGIIPALFLSYMLDFYSTVSS